jgi:predicted DNA-binding transcriptional regulator AlpA
MVNTDDLCDAHEVASLLGLSHPNSVFGYLRRYADMPRPVVTAGRSRIALWLRPEVESWCAARPRRQATGASGRGAAA